jgi:hypothetical protein
MQTKKIVVVSRDWMDYWLEYLISSLAHAVGIGSASHNNCTPS